MAKVPIHGICRYVIGTSHSAIMATSFYSSKTGSEIVPAAGNGDQERANPIIAHGHSHGHGVTLTTKDDSDSQLLGYREMVSTPLKRTFLKCSKL